MLRVVDLNSYKGDLNLNSIVYDAVITKATGGTGYVDSTCDKFVQSAITAGKPWGVYHYFSDGFNDGDPIAEANFFVDNCTGYVGKGLLILDWERGGNPDIGNVSKALAWLQHVESRTGVKPIIYMSLSLITSMDWSSVISNGNGLWCADYVDNNTPIVNYAMDSSRDPNPKWDGNVNDVLWQFTSTGRLDGYGGNLDCSFFYGTRATWDAYAGTHTTASIVVPAPVEAVAPATEVVTQTTSVSHLDPVATPPVPSPVIAPTSVVIAVTPPVKTTTITITPKPSIKKLSWFMQLLKWLGWK